MSFHVLFEIITPFLVYLLAEFVGVSGIIAVVSAGIAHSFERRAVTPSSARLNVVSTSVWSVLDFTLNGLVFLILGTQLPYVVERIWTGSGANTNYLLIAVVLILVFILALRFVWMFIMRCNVNLRQADKGLVPETGVGTGFEREDEEEDSLSLSFGEMSYEERDAAIEKRMARERQELRKARSERRQALKEARRADRKAARSDEHYWGLHLKDALVLSFSGVKGAITLAIILSVPMTLGGITPFPERDLLIFLASGVIVLSLLMANIVVPLIAPKKKQSTQGTSELNATLDIYRKVITGLTASSDEQERSAVNEVVRQYYNRIETLKVNNSLRLPNETRVRHYAIEMQLQNTQYLTDNDKVSRLTAYYCIDILSRQLSRVEHHTSLRWEFRALIDQLFHRRRLRKKIREAQLAGGPSDRMVFIYDLHTLQMANLHYAVEKLEELEPSEEFPAYTVGLIRNEIKQRAERLESRWEQGGARAAGIRRDQNVILEVETRALELERKVILQALDDGAISADTAKMLRDNVALMELDIEDQLD